MAVPASQIGTWGARDATYTDPALDAFAITPSGSNLAKEVRAIYVGTAGNVELVTHGGSTVLFKNLANGSILPVAATKVTTNTTATDLVGLV